PSGRGLALRTTTSVDGSFSFPGAAVGPFTLAADKADVQAIATASGSVDHGGQAVDVSIVAKIAKASFGRIERIVHGADGGPAGDAQVDLCYGGCPPPRAPTTADHNSAALSFHQGPLGPYGF